MANVYPSDRKRRSDSPLTEIGKICTGCHEDLPLDQFNRQSRAPSGVRARCKPCQQEEYRDYVARGGARVKALRKASKYRQRFKMSMETVEDLFAATGYCCASCGTHRDDTYNKALVLDHDHGCCPTERTCGKCVRGVLCTKCNVALGALDDDPVKVKNLLRYVEEPRD